MEFFGLAAIVAVLGILPVLVARKFALAGIIGVAATLLLWGFFYLNPPELVQPYWGAAGVLVGLLWVLGALIEGVPRGKPGPAALFPALALLAFLGRGCGGWAAFRSSEYRDIIGQVDERVWTQDVQPKDPNHVRLVPTELAAWLADKQLGAALGTIGSQYTVDKAHMTIQMVNGSLWYVAPLEFKDYGTWSSTGTAPGYVMVSAEDPRREAIVKTGERYAYSPGAYFGHDLARHLWTHGYADRGLADYSFEVDDAGKGWWVVTVWHPSIAWSGERMDGVVIVDPTDGSSTFHATGSIPAWVDRAVPASFVTDYLAWRGKYRNGWVNSWWGEKDCTRPDSLSFVHGSDGEPYWVADVTSCNENDNALVGLVYVDARTGKAIAYRAHGGTNDAVLQAVNAKIAYRKWHGQDPVLYNMYGTMAAIVPLLGDNHTYQGVAIVNIEKPQDVAVGDDLLGALREYQKLLSGSGAATPELAHATRSLSGVVDRFSADVRGQETTYYLHLKDGRVIFTGGSELSPKLPLTRIGDSVTLAFIESDEAVVPLVSFDNGSLPLSGAAPPAPALTRH